MFFRPAAPAHGAQAGDLRYGIWSDLKDDRRRIYCNRSLNMTSIRAVGFDMDYTLAQYKPETFENPGVQATTEARRGLRVPAR